jgi:hypothetical protein
MVTLPEETIYGLIKISALISISFLVLVFVLRKACAQVRCLAFLLKLKIIHILFVGVVGLALCFIVSLGLTKSVVQRDILLLLRGLRKSTKLEIYPDFQYDSDIDAKEILIAEGEKIKRLHDLLSNVTYKRVHRPGVPDIVGAIGVGAYDNGKLLTGFTVYDRTLMVYPLIYKSEAPVDPNKIKSKIHQYEASDKDILIKIRQSLGLRR